MGGTSCPLSASPGQLCRALGCPGWYRQKHMPPAHMAPALQIRRPAARTSSQKFWKRTLQREEAEFLQRNSEACTAIPQTGAGTFNPCWMEGACVRTPWPEPPFLSPRPSCPPPSVSLSPLAPPCQLPSLIWPHHSCQVYLYIIYIISNEEFNAVIE